MLETIPGHWWALVITGLGAGVISGALGVGSGIVFVPVLVAVFLLPQKSAQATTLAVMVPMALLGALRYWRNPAVEINPVVVALLVLGALAGVLIGTELAHRLPAHWLRKAFAVFMILVAARMLLVSPRRGASSTDPAGQSPADVTKPKG